jgi:hypothetical protein
VAAAFLRCELGRLNVKQATRALVSGMTDEPAAPVSCYPNIEIEGAIQVGEYEIASVLADGKRLVVTRKLPPREIVMWMMSEDGSRVHAYSQDEVKAWSEGVKT